MNERSSFTQRVVEVFLTGNLSPLLLLLSLVAGAIALFATPREEDPQIVVPVIDVVLDAPGTPALEVERQVVVPLEQILRRIDGVEYVYSMSRRGQGVVTARFYVGQDREDSLVKLHSALRQHEDAVPPQVKGFVVRPVAIDDVPIVAVTLHSDRLDDHDLRRIAEELQARLQQVPETGVTEIHGGRPRRVTVEVDPVALAGRGLPFTAVQQALMGASAATAAGAGLRHDRVLEVEVDPMLPDAAAVARLVVGTSAGQPVHLHDVAAVRDGPAEVEDYVRFGRGLAGGGAAAAAAPMTAAVTLSVAKRRGANAVSVAAAIEARLDELRREVLPDDVDWTITRDSGRTADGKVDELLEGLSVAIAIVVILITMMLGWREAVVVALAVPVTFGLTLLVNQLAGYSINRVTLFSLILSLGLVVDDPIVDVENIHRHLQRREQSPLRAVLAAVNEVRPPVIVATLAVIISFLPLFFITGMMGPYMRPMALNVPMAMLMSMLVAFTLTPWMAYLALRRAASRHAAGPETSPAVTRAYAAVLRPLLRSRRVRAVTFAGTALLFLGVGWLGASRAVPLKMLPFDNKTELQVLVDLDEGSSLERTMAVVSELAGPARSFVEVLDVTAYAGVPSPMDFNGMVRKYYLRRAPNLGELRVRLLDKHERQHQSHQVALRLRAALAPLASARGATLRVVELPPGPPVLSTVVAEVRGTAATTPAQLDAAARELAARLAAEPGVADVDTSAEATPPELHFVLDHEKAALHGVTAARVGQVLEAAVGGRTATVLHAPREVNPLGARVCVEPWRRADPQALGAIAVAAAEGDLVPLAELGRFEPRPTEPTVHHKDLDRVAYVMAEAVGRTPAEIVLDVQADQVGGPVQPDATPRPRPLGERTMLRPGGGLPWSLPAGFTVDWRGEGEWKITLDAFRDLGLAFLAACLGIYVLLVQQTKSYGMPLVLMLSIPFTILGILPGFWLLNRLLDVPVAGVANPVFFTATAMIGMIALAGIAVRNSILLIDFIEGALARGTALEDAILQSGAVRLRPIVLTAGAAILASIPITLDPIFSGLAWALIFGLVVSSLFTLVLVPVVYFGVARRREEKAR